MVELDDKEIGILFGSIDTNHNGEISFSECMCYFDSLRVSIKEYFHRSIAKFLEI